MLLLLIGHGGLGLLLNAGKLEANFTFGPLFGIFVLLMFFAFLRDNVWRPIDAVWIRRAGGLSTAATAPPGASTSARRPGSGSASPFSASPWRCPG